MAKAETVVRIKDAGVIPVVRAESAQDAIRLAEAVMAGGLPVVEIALTVPGALQVIERLAQDFGDTALLGAGSVLDAEAARAAIGAGARFVVSPVLDSAVVAACRERDVVAIPGALTPTEVVRARDAGADLVKVFPVSALGGASYIRALLTPMPQLELVPTGGVRLEDVAAYLTAGAAAVGAGSGLADPDALARGHPASVSAAARDWVEAVRAARSRPTTSAPS